MSRSYKISDIKKLWGEAAGRCSFPKCRQRLIIPGNEEDKTAVIGEIAHIEAHSDDGPRPNLDLTREQRDSYDNLILLCPTHHKLVDSQPKKYNSEVLRRWKKEHEDWVREQLSTVEFTFRELEQIMEYLISTEEIPTNEDYTIIPVEQKIKKNGLSSRTHSKIIMGLSRSPLVDKYIRHMAMIQPKFPDQLRSGFVKEYDRLYTKENLRGDDLFNELWDYSCGRSKDFDRRAAALAVLSHLFIICEVFEK